MEKKTTEKPKNEETQEGKPAKQAEDKERPKPKARAEGTTRE
ncbi:hypothetical protein ACQ1ZE_15185 [Enterococcus faecalis]